jgi:putative (di)nucleoside polyphosphate hydrolase
MAKPHFRAGVVTVVRREDGKVLAFERSDRAGQWQLPQGGIESGESPHAAAWRELAEETGLDQRHVRLVGEHEDWTVYAWPDSMRPADRLGQVHRWFFFEWCGADVDPKPDGREFRDWRWMETSVLIEQVVDFRQGPYRSVLGG